MWFATAGFIGLFAALIVTAAREPDGRGWHDVAARSVVRYRQRRFTYAPGAPNRQGRQTR